MSAAALRFNRALQGTAPLHSAQWFRVATLKPRLDSGARVQRQVVRGEVWHVLVRADGTRSFRLNAAAWSLIGRCDGELSLHRLWDLCLQSSADAAPTQDEVLDWLSRLQKAGFLSVDRWPAGELMPGRAAGADDAASPQQAQSWMAWRIPLGRPDAWLARLASVLRPWLLWRGLLPLLCVLLLMWIVGACLHADELLSATSSLAQSPRGLWLALLVYPGIKLLHEMAHGVMARVHGAPVPQWGISLLMFLPVPYVDASAASALPRAGQRLAVAGAGIAVELLVAGAGLLLALQVQPGWLRDLGLTLFFIGALSTLAVNGNPLLRFDGYHMLCDAAGLPNLATRSQRWWMQQLRTWVLRAQATQPLQPARNEAPWLWAYAPLALVMRWVVSLAVLIWLAGISSWLALAVALALAWGLVCKPLLAGIKAWRGGGLPAAVQARATRRLLLLFLLLGLGLGAVPWPDRTVAHGVWWLPESALVRTQVEGFVAEVLVEHGQDVAAGQALLRLHSPALEADESRLLARLQALESEHWQALRDDAAHAVQVDHERAAVQAELARTQSLLAHRWVRAAAAGPLAMTAEEDMPGRWLPRGSLVAHVMTGEAPLVKVAIAQEQAALVAQAAAQVEVRRASAWAPALAGSWQGQTSGGGARLPSPALADRAGGPIPVDPADEQGLRPLRAVVLADVRVQLTPASGETGTAERIGERVLVRFDHGFAPLAWQAARSLQQLVLRHWNPSS